jgi:hypothetical protein
MKSSLIKKLRKWTRDGVNYRNEPSTWLGKLKEELGDQYHYKIRVPIRVYLSYIRRMWDYRKLLKEDRDWDSHFIYIMLQFKLERVYKALKNGFAIHEKKDMAALRRCIKLLKNLSKDDYDEKYFKAHNKKWGKLKTWYDPIEGSDNLSWKSSRPKAKTPAQQIREREEFKKTWENADEDRKNDRLELFDLLHKHLDAWWD